MQTLTEVPPKKIARVKMMKAHNRLNDHLNRRIVPEDLKCSG